MSSWFEPTSPLLVWGITAIAVATLGWAIFFVPRKSRVGWRAVAVQAVAVLLSIILSLLSLAVVLNQQNSWFPSWQSFGGPSELLPSRTVGESAKPEAKPTGWGTTNDAKDPRQNPVFRGHNWSDPAPNGRYLSLNIPGPASGHGGEALVWLPPSYLNNPNRAYPVIMGFQGIPGSPQAYREQLDIGKIIVGLSQAQQFREAIVVAPLVFPKNADTECVDARDGSVKMETYVAKDVVSWIKNNLRVTERPEGWATIGYSAGGWCSSMMTMRHPELFRHSINMSGYFAPDFPSQRPIPVVEKAYDLGHLARTTPPPVALWFASGKDDKMPMESLKSFTDQVRPPTSLTTQLLESGGHSWKVWEKTTPAGLKWLGATAEFSWVAP